MDWTTPERAIGGALDVTVLRILWTAGRSMTGAQVARVARAGSARGVRYALDRLAEQGLVTVGSVGQALVYDLNREHLLWPAVDAMFRALPNVWDELAARLGETVHRFYEPGKVSVAVFGSVARGDARLDSDVDVLLIVPELDEQAEDVQLLVASRVRAWTGQQAGVYLTSPERLRQAQELDDPILASFAQDAHTLIGPPFTTYLQEDP